MGKEQSLADELLKAVDRAFLKISKCDPYYRKIYEVQIATVNRQLSALLAQHAVAEPTRKLTWQHLSHAFTIANDFRNDDDEHYFTVMLNALNSISREGTVDPAAPKGLDRSSQNDSNPTAANIEPPLAPGEQF